MHPLKNEGIEGLHAERNAVDTAFSPSPNDLGADVLGVGLNRDFAEFRERVSRDCGNQICDTRNGCSKL